MWEDETLPLHVATLREELPQALRSSTWAAQRAGTDVDRAVAALEMAAASSGSAASGHATNRPEGAANMFCWHSWDAFLHFLVIARDVP